MVATIGTDEWLRFIKDEYLDGLIKNGGTSVKFPVPLDDGAREQIENGIEEQARQSGYLVARVSSSDTKIHMMDQTFFRIAEQIPWRNLSRQVLSNFARDRYGYTLEESVPIADGISQAKGIPLGMLRGEADPWMAKHVFLRNDLSRDFRVAMTHLCRAEMYGGPDGETRYETITDWLTGRNKAVSATKIYQIYTKITRSNARQLFESSLRWIRSAGYAGLVVILDTARITVAKNPKDGDVFYTKAAMLDAYEVLREFIDASDRMDSCLVVVVPAIEFTEQDPFSRGLGAYKALNLRVYNEVSDRTIPNPLATLLRLEGAQTT